VKRKNIGVIHVAGWALLLLSNLWNSYSGHRLFHNTSYNLPLFVKYFIIELSYLSIPIFCFYTAYLFVAPKVFVTHRYFTAFLLFLTTITGAALLRYSLEYYFFLPVFGFDNYRGHPWPLIDFVSNVFFYYFPRYFVYGLMYFFVFNWYKTRHLQQALEKERSATELAFLRSQINPHFLFNAINDIYSLIYQRSDDAAVALLKLSDMLRYMLREGSSDMVPLEPEIKYLENLIELQRISSKGRVYITFEIEGYIGGQEIASLLLISFVENAFKHGILTDAENPVRISLVAEPERLLFSVTNQKNTYEKDSDGGIGLNNVKRRLKLVYPDRHILEINNEITSYSIKLILQSI
jgi:two-component system, LytTR family, sensor kinase